MKSPAPINLGLCGLGTVGQGVLKHLLRGRTALAARFGVPIEVRKAAVRDVRKLRGVRIAPGRLTDDPLSIANDPHIPIVCELMGGTGIAREVTFAALRRGKIVISANKALICRHGAEIFELARRHGGHFFFEASVAGGVPIIKALREGLVANRFPRIYGILNGTCNYILTRMEREKLSFEACLADAQRLGYAEADPTFDIEGHDTAQKLAILASLAFGTRVDENAIYVEGISSITPADLAAADELGYRVKLLGVAVRTAKGIEQRVHPTMVRKDSAIADVMGVTNAVTIDIDGLDPLTLIGPGAGGMATASAVLSDIADIACG
ncbi:MAG: homoserine dehydrogenase, partial [Stellaceae bacterium]